MQRSQNTSIETGSFVVVKEKVGYTNMEQISTAQVVATAGDKLTIVTPGTSVSRTVERGSVQAYQDVYGTAVPGKGDRPIINQMA